MTTVAQFIEYLKTLPPDAQVRVIKEHRHGTEWVDLKIGTDNCYHSTHNGGNYLELGDK
jgi:hypothetical protein